MGFNKNSTFGFAFNGNGGGGGGGSVNAASNGTSLSGSTVVFGQSNDNVSNPAILTSNREIPLGNFFVRFSYDDGLGGSKQDIRIQKSLISFLGDTASANSATISFQDLQTVGAGKFVSISYDQAEGLVFTNDTDSSFLISNTNTFDFTNGTIPANLFRIQPGSGPDITIAGSLPLINWSQQTALVSLQEGFVDDGGDFYFGWNDGGTPLFVYSFVNGNYVFNSPGVGIFSGNDAVIEVNSDGTKGIGIIVNSSQNNTFEGVRAVNGDDVGSVSIIGSSDLATVSLNAFGTNNVTRPGDASVRANAPNGHFGIENIGAGGDIFFGVGGSAEANSVGVILSDGRWVLANNDWTPSATNDKLQVDGDVYVTGGIKSNLIVVDNPISPVAISEINDKNKLFSNEGAVGTVVYNLPAAVKGFVCQFYVQTNQTIQINAAALDTIRIGPFVSSVAGNITSNVVGSFITLVCVNSTEWVSQLTPAGTWQLN